MAVAARRRLTDQDRYLRSISEAAFQVRVIETARLNRWLVHHSRAALRQSGGYSTPIQGARGYLDLTMARKGRLIIAELKTEIGKLTEWEERWMEELTAGFGLYEGFEVYVWRPSDYDRICEVLQ